MEASIVSAAVTGMLKIVGNKLAPLVIKEYSSIVGVKKYLLELQDLAEEINCWLETEGDKGMGDAPSFNWLKKLKDVAYSVDDAVDQFWLETEKLDTSGDVYIVSKYLFKKPKSFLLQCKAAQKIKAIKKRFAVIVKQRTDLTTIVGHPVRSLNKATMDMPTLPIINEAAVLGRNQDKNKIITKLVKTNGQQEIEIVSITGLGGTGKTTLAKLVFNDGEVIKKHFDVRLWVHVSQEFNVMKLVEKLFEAVTEDKSDRHTLQSMSKEIPKYLSKKKFLLVLDDVWIENRSQHEQFQEQFMVHLKSGASGSKILLTTRSRRVAEAMRSTELYGLPFLSLDDSMRLFHRSFGAGMKELGDEYQQVGKEIVEKCGGVPLAIKVLAGTLRDKELIGEWKAIRDNNLLDAEGEESVSACLKLSYFYLPSHLKQCFTMCSLFPKGHQIYKEQLIDQWIAHNMINLTIGADYLEHNGHKYFNSLVQVYFLQDVEEHDGRVRRKMHDLVHDLARSILCEELSTIVPEDSTRSTKGYRYFSLIKQRGNLLPKTVFENARAIYVDNGDDINFGMTLKNAKHLRSMIVCSIRSTTMLASIFQVKNLKYLEMSRLRCAALPETIGDIWSLQALYIKSSNLLKLPKSIGKLMKLRRLNLSWCSELKSLPSNITTLENLEYLKLEKCNGLAELPGGIRNLTKLKELDLDRHIAIPAGIGQLTRLEKLNSFCVEFDKKYAQFSELATLSRISGKLSIYFLRRVMDPCDAHQACLKQKENLHDLELSWGSLHSRVNAEHEVAVLDGLEPPLGIKQLKISMYGGGQFAWWMLKQVGDGRGVQGLPQFPFLTKMILDDFPNLKQLDRLVQLPCLEKLHLKDMPALESISGGPFPSLVELKMSRLCSLGEVWMVTDSTLFSMGQGEGCSNHNPHQSGQLQFVQIGKHLTNLHIEDCPKLGLKPYFPISLEQLNLKDSNSNLLLSPCQSPGSSLSSNSPSSLNHLKVLKLCYMKASSSLSPPPGIRSGCRWELLQHMLALVSLEIFLCNDVTELPECLGLLCSLQKMSIKNCASLRSLPQSIGYLTSLQVLEIKVCDALVQFPEELGQLLSLRQLEIYRLGSLTCLPQSFCHLTSLMELIIGECEALVQLPENLGDLRSLCKLDILCLPRLNCLPQSLCRLISLQELQIGGCHALGELPECMGELHCLSKFKIWGLWGLTFLPQSLCCLTTSLKELEITSCLGLKSLPEGIKGLTALQRLKIDFCLDLERRCKRGTGEDWHLISHIPILRIG